MCYTYIYMYVFFYFFELFCNFDVFELFYSFLYFFRPFVPQIAGSYRGSYFSMDGFRIAEIGCRCRLVSQACLPS